MTPNRREKIRAMLNALERSPSAATFRNSGGTIIVAAHTNTIRFAGVSATCTWNADAQLVAAWIAAANRQLKRNRVS